MWVHPTKAEAVRPKRPAQQALVTSVGFEDDPDTVLCADDRKCPDRSGRLVDLTGNLDGMVNVEPPLLLRRRR